MVGRLLDRAGFRRRGDDQSVLTGDRAAHRGSIVEVAGDLRQRSIRDVELRA